MNVVWFASYRSRSIKSREPCNSVYLIRTFKHLSGENYRPYRLSRRSTLDTKNIAQALEWFGSLGAIVLETLRLPSPVVLVPIPDSTCDLKQFRPSRTVKLSEAIAVRTTTTVLVSDILRWKYPQPPSHRGGSRDPERLLRELVLTRMPPSGTIVLIDDVLTTGAHILASAEKIRGAGCRCEDAICVARTEARFERDTFAIRRATLVTQPRAVV